MSIAGWILAGVFLAVISKIGSELAMMRQLKIYEIEKRYNVELKFEAGEVLEEEAD